MTWEGPCSADSSRFRPQHCGLLVVFQLRGLPIAMNRPLRSMMPFFGLDQMSLGKAHPSRSGPDLRAY